MFTGQTVVLSGDPQDGLAERDAIELAELLKPRCPAARNMQDAPRFSGGVLLMNMMTATASFIAQGRVDRMKDLMVEARSLAVEQVEALQRALDEVRLLANEVSCGGEVYPPGIRELASRLALDASWATQTIGAIQIRTSPALPSGQSRPPCP